MYPRDRCYKEGEIRSAKCSCVEVRKTCLITHDHDLMSYERRGKNGNKEGEVKGRKVRRGDVLEVVWSDYWV